MANAPKKSKGGTAKSGEKRAASSGGREGTPARAGETPPLSRKGPESEESGGLGNYVIPALLGAALVAALAYSQQRNRAPAEPPAGPSAQESPSGGGGSAENPGGGANERRDPPRREPERPTPPAPEPTAQDVAVRATHPEPSSPDPRRGRFSIADATQGMPAGTTLAADIETSMGTFNCQLWPDRAPNTVANFVGLARGTRDWWDPVGGSWVRRAYYDGSVFHRVIPDFMIQGGDVLRTGSGGPGYEFADENVTAHNEAGLLCMANHGPNTNGGQFFILEEAKDHLNGSYSVFGRCTPTDLVERIARTPRTRRDQPLTPVRIVRVTVHR